MKAIWKCFLVLCSAFLVLSAFCYGVFYTHSKYDDGDKGKTSLFAGKNVMIIVPHEDDELNIAGGLIEEYLKYGSEIRVVFVTNGDYNINGEERLQESIDVLTHIGISKENIIFLGYGDGWNCPHIYNSSDYERKASIFGKMETYGLNSHPAYHEDNPYTRENLCTDLQNCISEYKPDIIFCSDYDSHYDHQSTSMFFEEVMGCILRKNLSYNPIVLKAFAYSTAYYAIDDYYNENICSTKNPYDSNIMQECNVYNWNQRIRLPIDGSTLSRSLLNANEYISARKYKSQDAYLHSVGIINGDKVFWERSTNSQCYNASIEVSSGDGNILNDFKLVDNVDIYGNGNFCEGVWHPDDDDSLKQASIVFPKEKQISLIRLYDNPSETDNVLNVHVTLDNGYEFDTGKLDQYGGTTEFIIPVQTVKKILISITDAEGIEYGLTEIEAFGSEKDTHSVFSFIKFQDTDSNFVYDFITPISGTAELTLYLSGLSNNINDYAITSSSPENITITDNGIIKVFCPKGQYVSLTASSSVAEQEPCSDTIIISNPGWLFRYGMKLESFIHSIIRLAYKETACYKLAKIVFW